MYLKNYNQVIKNFNLIQHNVYNTHNLSDKFNVQLSCSFNTFKNEKNLKFIKLYLLLFFIGGQKPFLKKAKFNYIKKKILKKFFMVSSLGNTNKNFFMLYFLNFYLYFFHIYYQKTLKYNFFLKKLIIYLDNIQFFFKNYSKQAQKTQIKITIFSKNQKNQLFMGNLLNLFLLKLKK